MSARRFFVRPVMRTVSFASSVSSRARLTGRPCLPSAIRGAHRSRCRSAPRGRHGVTDDDSQGSLMWRHR